MSYANGIGNLQQTPGLIAPTATKPSPQAIPSADAEKLNEASVSNAHQADQASLSSIGGLISQALGGPDVRLEKVSALQQSLADGSYNVSSSDVAAKLIESLLR